MPKPHFCHTCIFYEKDIFSRGADSFGVCRNVEVSMQVVSDGKSQLEEEGTFYTSKYFGCIYWRENDGTLIDINKTLEDGKSK